MSFKETLDRIFGNRAGQDAVATDAGAYGVVKTNSPLQRELASGKWGTIDSRLRSRGRDSDLEISGQAGPGMDLQDAGRIAQNINSFFHNHYPGAEMANHAAYTHEVVFADGSKGLEVGVYRDRYQPPESHYYDANGEERKSGEVASTDEGFGFAGTGLDK